MLGISLILPTLQRLFEAPSFLHDLIELIRPPKGLIGLLPSATHQFVVCRRQGAFRLFSILQAQAHLFAEFGQLLGVFLESTCPFLARFEQLILEPCKFHFPIPKRFLHRFHQLTRDRTRFRGLQAGELERLLGFAHPGLAGLAFLP